MGGSPSKPKPPKDSKLAEPIKLEFEVEGNKPTGQSGKQGVSQNREYVNDRRKLAISKSRSKSAKKATQLTGHNEQSRAARTPKNPHLKRAVKIATKGDDRR